MLNKLRENWTQILEYMRDEFEITGISFTTWLEPLEIRSCDGQTVVLLVPDEFTRDYVEKKYTKMLQVAIGEKLGKTMEVRFMTPQEASALESAKETGPDRLIQTPGDVDIALIDKANLNPKYTFDNFVVGPNNNLAHAAAVAVAESPGQAYKILYIYGGVGLGKTHLMHAVAHYILKNNPSSKILYVTSETFTNDYIESIRNNNVKGSFNTSDFRNKYRDLDVLLIDDIQFITGKVSTQEEFFHTFNALNERNKQIIISSDKPPKAIDGLEERLRLKMGQLVKKIQKERKITTIFVTHDKREALQMSDKIALMAEGKILQYRTPENIFFQPVSRYAAEYFGKCNYLRGQVRNGRFEGSRLENRISQKVGSGDGHLQPSEDQGRESI